MWVPEWSTTVIYGNLKDVFKVLIAIRYSLSGRVFTSLSCIFHNSLVTNTYYFIFVILVYILICSDGGETQADFSEVFPDCEVEEEKSGDFYNTPASPITVPYCPRPPSTGILIT